MKEFNTQFVSYTVKGNLLIATYKKGTRINLPIARKIVQERLSFMGNRPMVALVYNQGVISMDKEARDFFSSPKGNEGLIAGAIIVDCTFTSILGNFFLKVSKPNIPARMFANTEQAIKWLEKFVT
jgi:hypothetical protein